MASLAFIASPAQWQALRAQDGETPRCAVSDFEVLLDLRAAGGEPVDLWSFCSGAELCAQENQAWDACRALGETLRGTFALGDFDPILAVKNDLYSVFRTVITTDHVVSRALEAVQPDRVWHGAEMDRAIYWEHGDGNPGPFNAAVAHCAEKAGLPIETFALPDEMPHAPAPQPPPDPEALPLSGPEVQCLSFAVDYACEEQGLLLDALPADRRDFVAVGTRPPRAPFSYQPFHDWRRLPLRMNLGRRLDFSEQDFLDALSRCEGLPDCLSANRNIAFMRNALLDWLAAAVGRYAQGTLLARAYRPKAVVCGCEVAGADRCLAQAFMDEGIPAISVGHWGNKLETTHRRNMDATAHVAISGHYERSGHERWRAESARIFEVGSLRRDLAFLGDRVEAAPQPARPRIVIFTAKVLAGELMFSLVAPDAYVRAWDELRRIAEAHPDWDIAIKPHPRVDYFRFYQEYVCAGLPNLEVLEGIGVEESLRGASAALIMNTPSWVLPEIIARGIPVVFMRDAVLYAELPQMESGGAVVVRETEALEPAMLRLHADADYRKQVCEEARAFLQRAVRHTGDGARDALLEAVDACAATTIPHAPDPLLRWILDVNQVMHYYLCGRIDAAAFHRALAELEARKAGLVFESDSLILEQVGMALMDAFFRDPIARRECFDLPAALDAIYTLLPEALRPGFKDYRPYRVHAWLDEASRRARGFRKWGYRARAFALAPSRLRSGWTY